MERSETALARRARRAYERGRLIRGLARAGLLVPVVVWTGSWCPHPVLGLVCGAALVALTAGFLWRGQVWRRAVGPGLAAGLAPLLLPLLMRGAGEVCMGEACWPLCAVSCVGGGLLAGVLVGRRAAALSEGRATFLAAAGMLALLAGAPACALAGAVGLGGLLVGFAAGTTPAVLARASA
ncbi:MAG: hypothetical protein DMF80_19165 [Acidobacteria bacterium]|nr:MAG: hypothetical protein DMF80_19165 [Acidobacteriota bacterium]